MLNFNFSEKGLELLSLQHFVPDFSRKMFLMLHSINWPNFIVWCCDVIKFEINSTFLIKPFRYMTKKSRQKLKHLENEKNFWGEMKRIFHYFQRAFRPESAPLSAFKSEIKKWWPQNCLCRLCKRYLPKLDLYKFKKVTRRCDDVLMEFVATVLIKMLWKASFYHC